MSATLLLEKRISIEGETAGRSVEKEDEKTDLICTCNLSHMASHNALCLACSKLASREK